MPRIKITHVVGARPNFMKVAPVMAALAREGSFEQMLVHTGQHYDANMSDIFFEQLGMPKPDVNLEVGSGTPSAQTAQIMLKFEDAITRNRPEMVLVYGDVTSTVATALVSVKNRIPVAHIEAGLRSRDRSMPEEINRLLTDQMADLLFTPSRDGNINLAQEGIAESRIHLVGNVMIDTLVRLLPQARLPAIEIPERYILVTLHRPSNVDEPIELKRIAVALKELSNEIPVIFPVHPRTRQRLIDLRMDLTGSQITLTDPLGYLEFLALQKGATVVVTDSGGIQEETTYLGVPCLTLRENTERPVTVEIGTNLLVGRDLLRMKDEIQSVLMGRGKQGSRPEFWDGKAGERIAGIMKRHLRGAN